jgi:hypothetical protein
MTGEEYKELKLWLKWRGETCPSESYLGSMAWYHSQLEEYKKIKGEK